MYAGRVPRPRSEEKRRAILAAATRTIAAHGLGVSTAAIANEAGVATGSLFVYFETKPVLLNELYITLKAEMGSAAVADLPAGAETLELLRHMWAQWLAWATTNPEKRRTLAQLEVAEEITDDSIRLVRDSQRDMADLLERARSTGPMREVPLGFVLTLASGIADATMDAILREPAHAEDRSAAAFEGLWRMLAGPAL